MGRYTGPKCRLCRREGVKLFLKGTRCESQKCAMVRHSQVPGQHGKVGRRLSNYFLQLREKQKVKRIYGVLEAQFRKYFRMAEKHSGATGAVLLGFLERRLDNVVCRLGLAPSRAAARQAIRHGRITVGGKKVDRPSYLVNAGEIIKATGPATAADDNREIPAWLIWNKKTREGTVSRLPEREEIDPTIKEQLIVEFYSR
ncbi:30S ribosomal protein S4 [Candidatus Parcubacteria bacterium]|nr:30S ribosomal protein S4 [Candidatus Parcubacteria bacterium]